MMTPTEESSALPLRHRIQSNPETIQDLEWAAEERYWSGIELLASGHQGSGVYLLGFVAEMILKRSCFVFDGLKPLDYVAPRLGAVRAWARIQLPGISPENYHSLVFWMNVLVTKRSMINRNLAPEIEAPLTQRVRRLFGIWTVDMRYQPDRTKPTEVRSVYDDVTWIRDHRFLLGL